VSLGDLGESKDCTGSGSLFAGTTECHKLAAEYLNGYGEKFDVVGGNHDLEGIDEFFTDEANLEAYLRELGGVENCDKKTAQFSHQIAEKTVLIGLGSTKFRSAEYTSHEVVVDNAQVAWFKEEIAKYPAEDGWNVFCFSHAPIIGSGLRVLQECHVVNGCCWLNHNDGPVSRSFIETVRANPAIKGWFSGHFHLSHDYEDSMSFPEGNNRGACIFAQTAVMTARSTRDGRRQSRLIRGNKDGFEVCTVNHAKGGEVRVDAKITYSDCGTSTVTEAVEHEELTANEGWFRSYTPQEEDGCYIKDSEGVLNEDATWDDSTVCWWHMSDGAVLGVHDGMVIEYDPTTLAPLGMVVSKDELAGRKVAVIDSGLEAEQCNVFEDGAECTEMSGKEQALILYDEASGECTVIQPNEDGSYWRKIVRNKMVRMKESRRPLGGVTPPHPAHSGVPPPLQVRMKESRRVKAAKKFMAEIKGEEAEASDARGERRTNPVGTLLRHTRRRHTHAQRLGWAGAALFPSPIATARSPPDAAPLDPRSPTCSRRGARTRRPSARSTRRTTSRCPPSRRARWTRPRCRRKRRVAGRGRFLGRCSAPNRDTLERWSRDLGV